MIITNSPIRSALTFPFVRAHPTRPALPRQSGDGRLGVVTRSTGRHLAPARDETLRPFLQSTGLPLYHGRTSPEPRTIWCLSTYSGGVHVTFDDAGGACSPQHDVVEMTSDSLDQLGITHRNCR